MPLVHITYKPTVKVETLRNLIPVVNKVVADQLYSGDATGHTKVKPGMVKIYFVQASELDSQTSDILVEVEGRLYDERRGKHEAYAAALGEAIAPLLTSGLTYGIWVKLCHAGWHGGLGEAA